MNITIKEKSRSFTFEYEGEEFNVKFSDILDSVDWQQFGFITIKHGNSSTTLNRAVFLETMKEGSEGYHKKRGVWELNTQIHRLYKILDGGHVSEADKEIENLSKLHTDMWHELLDWNNKKVERIAAVEHEVEQLSAGFYPDEATMKKIQDLKRKVDRMNKEEPPFHLRDEMERLYQDARDDSKPEIKFSNIKRNKGVEYIVQKDETK